MSSISAVEYAKHKRRKDPFFEPLCGLDKEAHDKGGDKGMVFGVVRGASPLACLVMSIKRNGDPALFFSFFLSLCSYRGNSNYDND